MKLLLELLTLCLLSVAARAAECHGKPSPDAKPNLNPIYTNPPRLVKSVKNGMLFLTGEAEDVIPIVHVWGSPYEMGYAHGELMKEKAQQLVHDVWEYMKLQVEQGINGTIDIFPGWFLSDIANLGLEAALDLETDVTKPYTGSYFYEELKGLSDGSGAPYKTLERIHMIGELTKGACSMFGANESAVPAGGGLLQLRALDWNVDGPFKNFPQVTVYHPNDTKHGHAFANIGFTGWIGSITGFSSQLLAISEIGVSFPDETFGHESRFGIPFTYILRDILQFDKTLEDAMTRLRTAHRTCNLILGVGDAKVAQFRGVEYSAATADFFTWDNLRPEADWHPRIKDIVYWGMDWLCPGFNEVMAAQLNKYHGNLTAEITIQEIVPIVQTGDLHIAVYDLTNGLVYISYAKGESETGPLYAYDRTFIEVKTADLFNVTPPGLV